MINMIFTQSSGIMLQPHQNQGPHTERDWPADIHNNNTTQHIHLFLGKLNSNLINSIKATTTRMVTPFTYDFLFTELYTVRQ